MRQDRVRIVRVKGTSCHPLPCTLSKCKVTQGHTRAVGGARRNQCLMQQTRCRDGCMSNRVTHCYRKVQV